MFLAFHLSDIVTVPFGWLLSVLYHLTDIDVVDQYVAHILAQLP